MNLLPRWVWTTTDTLRRKEAEVSVDPGDMGTAFGLDASLAPPPEDPADAAVPESGWQQRLDKRPRR